MVVFPNAKINLGLDILRKRPDGYHDISTIMIPVPWHDILEIVPSKGGMSTLTVTGRPVDCPAEKNLVMKAFRRVQLDHSIPEVDIYLRKIIPDGAGLGGGSADAAFTIMALNSMFGLDLSKDKMASMASEIGADCAFFIYNRPMLAEGKGERLTEIDIDLSDLKIAIVKPEVSISTAEAYAGVTPGTPLHPLSEIASAPRKEWRNLANNAFEESIRKKHCEINSIKEALYDTGAFYASMSGSGSAVFGLFENDILSPVSSRLSCFGSLFIGAIDQE